MNASVLSPWASRVSVDAGDTCITNYPLLADVVSSAMMDDTGTPADALIPDINLVALLVRCTAEQLAVIEADSRFLVLWSE
jgi:hypothetical protein